MWTSVDAITWSRLPLDDAPAHDHANRSHQPHTSRHFKASVALPNVASMQTWATRTDRSWTKTRRPRDQ
jgi:hypothetical protein